MKLDNRMCELISDMEKTIGSRFYNPRSYNGYTGEEGLEYRYPVSYAYSSKIKEPFKEKDKILFLKPSQVKSMRYVNGSNHLYVGDGILDIIDLLEKRYDLDFNELEKEYEKKRKKIMRLRAKEIEKTGEVELAADEYVIGLDLPEGEFSFMADNFTILSIQRPLEDKRGCKSIYLEDNKKQVVQLFKGDILIIRTSVLICRHA